MPSVNNTHVEGYKRPVAAKRDSRLIGLKRWCVHDNKLILGVLIVLVRLVFFRFL